MLETAEIAKKIHFNILKRKYRLVGQAAFEQLYEIMLKLEREERLDPKQVVQLITEGHLSPNGEIARAYYRLEAIFYEKEYQRTGNKRNLASASSNWRKADKPENALQVTNSVNLNKIKELDLKSALAVTRGAAFRDLGQLKEAHECAKLALECQPNTHQPYTLMGAIAYDLGQYEQGYSYFQRAAELGDDQDVDDEIKRVLRMTKDKEKRREAAQYLINKDPDRYQWATVYVK